MIRARRLTVLGLLALTPCALRAGEVADAVVTLQVLSRTTPDQVPEAAPVRFVMLKEGEIFVGGTAGVAAGQLDKKERKELEKSLSRLEKLPGLGSPVTLGPGSKRYRLRLARGRPPEIAATGDAASAPAALRPLATLLAELEDFSHPSLRNIAPATYALGVAEASLDAGCRPWGFRLSLAEALAGIHTIPAADAADWPKGANPASVCAGDRRYRVVLRPLLPGERP
jgi:hypothetical protein